MCDVHHLLISEVKTRGVNGTDGGSADEFVEIFNPTDYQITVEGFTIEANGSSGYRTVYGPRTLTLQRFGRYVVGGASFSGDADGRLADGASLDDTFGEVRLRDRFLRIIDSLCYCTGSGCDARTTPYCEGELAASPFDSNPSDADVSMARIPAGLECVDTDNNATDFHHLSPSTPGR